MYFQRRIFVIFISLLFSLALNCKGFYGYFLNKSNFFNLSPDEPYYLTLSRDFAQSLHSESYFYELKKVISFKELLLYRPAAWLDIVFGKLAFFLNVSVVELSFFTDLITSFTCFYLLFYFYFKLSNSILASFMATLSMLGFATVFQLRHYFSIFYYYIGNILVTSFPVNDLAVTRSIATQISFPIFIICLYALLKYINGNIKKYYSTYVSIISATLFYIYFFAWGAACVLISLAFVGSLFSESTRKNIKEHTIEIIGASFLHIFLIIPGIWISLSYGYSGVASFDELRKFLYSPLDLIIILLFLIFILIKSNNIKIKKVITLAIICIFAEIICGNFQPLLKKGLAPYHFAELYIRPLLLGCIILYTYLKLDSSKFFFIPKIMLTIFLIVIFIMKNIFPVEKPITIEREHLFEYLKQNTAKDAVIAMKITEQSSYNGIPDYFPYIKMPQLIYLYTNRHILNSEWVLNPNNINFNGLLRERLLSVLLNNKDELLWPCLENPPKLPGDIFYLTWTYYLYNRYNICSKFSKEIKKISTCEVIKKYKVDYLLLENSSTEASYLKKVWQSPKGTYSIYQISKSLLLEEYC